MSESWVRVGAQCVCVDDGWSDDACEFFGIEPPNRYPMINEVLTIKAFYTDHPLSAGIVLEFSDLGNDYGWPADHFRPLVSERDDVAAFEAIAFKPKLDIELEQLEAAWRMSEADEMPRPMTGFFAMLTPEQKRAVLDYRGDDNISPITPQELPPYGSVIADDADLRWIEEQARKGGK